MSQLLHDYRYYPDEEKSGFLVDQVGQRHQVEYMDYTYDGSSVYNMYAHDGRIRKSVPLTARPPINRTYNGFKGTIMPSDKAPSFYNVSEPFYYAPM